MFSTPTVAGDLIFIGSCSGLFYALDKENGEVRWSYDIKQDGIPTEFHGDPLIADSLVVIASDGRGTGHVYAFVRETGRLRWKFPVARGVPTDLARDDYRVYAVTYHDLDLQKNLWRAEAATEWSSTRPYVWHESVLVGNDLGEMHAFRASDGVVQWSHDFGGVIRGIGTTDRVIYVGTLKGMVYAFMP